MIYNSIKATQFNKVIHADLFEARKSGAYARYGKKMLCIDHNAIKFGRYV